MKLKKLFALGLGMGLGVSLLSCGNNNNTTKPNVGSTTTTIANTTTVANTTTIADTTTTVNTTTVTNTTTTTSQTTTNEELYVIDKGISDVSIFNYSSSLTQAQIETELSKKFQTNGTVTHGEITVATNLLFFVEYHFTKDGKEETKELQYIIISENNLSSFNFYVTIYSNSNGFNYGFGINDNNQLSLELFIYNPTNINITINNLNLSFIVNGKEVTNGSFNFNQTINKNSHFFHYFNFSDYDLTGITTVQSTALNWSY